jgi:hypothetical protein
MARFTVVSDHNISTETLMTGIRFLTTAAVLIVVAGIARADDLRERLWDANGVRDELWVYNDIPKAREEAWRVNKPLFVTFRCVPCRDCAAFDADVANGNESVREFAMQNFVSVRQVEMKGVDLSQFQFDHDLNWAAMFIHPDGTVYARYGTQSAEGSDAYNSIDGLLATMQRVLEMHAAYPANKAELEGKLGSPKPVSDALELPGLSNPAKYAQLTTRDNCIHCHNIHDAEHKQALGEGRWSPELMWKYPLPDNIGLRMDRKEGVLVSAVSKDSAAAVAGLQAGDVIALLNGQRIASIADMQWVLHHLPGDHATLTIETAAGRQHTVELSAGWKKSDFSWRGSMWNAPPRIQVWLPELTADEQARLQIPADVVALEARWINREGKGGQQAFDDGLREKDVIVALDGEPIRMKSPQFHQHVKLTYRVGDRLPLTVLRDGRRIELKILLVE